MQGRAELARRDEEALMESLPLAPGFVFDYLAYLLAAASERMSAEFHEVVRDSGLRVPEWRVLASLASFDELTVSELARITLYDQPRLTKILNQMVFDGLVRRAGDPLDRRRVLIHMTAAGKARVAPLVQAATSHEDRILAELSVRERAALKMILKRLIGEHGPLL